ncbi:1,4-alpha-glucan branching protein GlgB [Marinomonas mediterranea]|uniref:1,4-alpha-glucan branching protein GlgB n=1 Tax=Marinomonas mediterranea TaxID=119864 RepID=UPI00234BEBE5|nr:1,4-alpha-glucan branching protein GlgB [Marinomonas mediterranea]WCN14344.1 1,4-alpha-glucan branching protein GlgB [Marinomonas mediterranea]
MDLFEDIVNARCSDPFGFLGLHWTEEKDLKLNVWRPDAVAIDVLAIDADSVIGKMNLNTDSGLFSCQWSDKKTFFHYRLRITFSDGNTATIVDPYQFNQATFADPEHHKATLYQKEGALFQSAPVTDSLAIDGTRFAVYAPAARSVYVVGDFNGWDGRIHPMSSNGDGVWRLFIPDVRDGAKYKFEIRAKSGDLLPHRTDPFAKRIEQFPSFASVVQESQYHWNDESWMSRPISDIYEEAVSIYEVHLGSWRKKEHNESLTYLELKEQLVPYVVEMGYTHVELLPVMEYPFDGSWGYQPVGLFAVTSRYGTPDEFKALIDAFHQAGISVIMDWVPAHFPSDSHGLANFDGTHQYEYEDPKKGWHPEWNSLIYDFGKEHVVDFLISNANFWLEEYHIDGLRVDAVASMLYLDYSREDGEWIPNVHGGNHNYEAIAFLKQLNETVYLNHPRCFTVAEESTAFSGVSKPTYMDGLGFGFKWNMGWMNDTLEYMKKDPIHRQYHQGELTFSMVYAFNEQFMLPISHDEVVHGKGSMIDKMPGDGWQKFANLRAFNGYMFAHPGKKLNFMGNEFAQGQEWSHTRSLDWHLLDIDYHKGLQTLVKDLNHLYTGEPALQLDHDYQGFEWLSYDDSQNSILAYVRQSKAKDELLIVVVNFTPTPHKGYRIGAPKLGRYDLILNTDASIYGGSGFHTAQTLEAESIENHGRNDSVMLDIPPLSTVIYKWKS